MTTTRYNLTITKIDGSVWYDATSPTERDLETVQRHFDVIVSKARSGNVLFPSFKNVASVKVEAGEVFAE